MGSGSAAVAALKSNRKYIGYDNDPEDTKLVEQRIAPIKMQLGQNI